MNNPRTLAPENLMKSEITESQTPRRTDMKTVANRCYPQQDHTPGHAGLRCWVAFVLTGAVMGIAVSGCFQQDGQPSAPPQAASPDPDEEALRRLEEELLTTPDAQLSEDDRMLKLLLKLARQE